MPSWDHDICEKSRMHLETRSSITESDVSDMQRRSNTVTRLASSVPTGRDTNNGSFRRQAAGITIFHRPPRAILLLGTKIFCTKCILLPILFES